MNSLINEPLPGMYITSPKWPLDMDIISCAATTQLDLNGHAQSCARIDHAFTRLDVSIVVYTS